MSLRFVFLFVALVSASCGDCASLKQGMQMFEEHRSTFVELRQMIEADTAGGKCRRIGPQHIVGWWKKDDGWYQSSDYNHTIPLASVLREASLSESRYKQYLRLLSSIGKNSFVEHCNNYERVDTRPTWTRFKVLASGVSVSGCTTLVHHRGSRAIPKNEEAPGFFYHYATIDIDDVWYVEYSCT